MSLLKSSILATEKVTHFKIYHHKDKRSNYYHQYKNIENEAFEVGFVLLKIK